MMSLRATLSHTLAIAVVLGALIASNGAVASSGFYAYPNATAMANTGGTLSGGTAPTGGKSPAVTGGYNNIRARSMADESTTTSASPSASPSLLDTSGNPFISCNATGQPAGDALLSMNSFWSQIDEAARDNSISGILLPAQQYGSCVCQSCGDPNSVSHAQIEICSQAAENVTIPATEISGLITLMMTWCGTLHEKSRPTQEKVWTMNPAYGTGLSGNDTFIVRISGGIDCEHSFAEICTDSPTNGSIDLDTLFGIDSGHPMRRSLDIRDLFGDTSASMMENGTDIHKRQCPPTADGTETSPDGTYKPPPVNPPPYTPSTTSTPAAPSITLPTPAPVDMTTIHEGGPLIVVCNLDGQNFTTSQIFNVYKALVNNQLTFPSTGAVEPVYKAIEANETRACTQTHCMIGPAFNTAVSICNIGINPFSMSGAQLSEDLYAILDQCAGGGTDGPLSTSMAPARFTNTTTPDSAYMIQITEQSYCS